MKKFILMLLVLILPVLVLTGCTHASVITHNIQQDADTFNVYRKMTFINLYTNELLYSAEGYFSVQTTHEGNFQEELALVFKVGEDEYKMNYFSLANNVTYVIEQLENTNTDPYHWKIVWHVATPDIVVS